MDETYATNNLGYVPKAMVLVFVWRVFTVHGGLLGNLHTCDSGLDSEMQMLLLQFITFLKASG